MAWLSTYDATNRIDLGKCLLAGSMFFGEPGAGQWRHLITETRYRYHSMTETAAYAAVVTIQGASTWNNVIVAVAERQNDAGAYQVNVTETLTGAWEQET